MLVEGGFGRNIRQNLTKSSLTTPVFAYSHSLSLSQSPKSLIEGDTRFGLPPKIHRVADLPVEITSPFESLSPASKTIPILTAAHDGSAPQILQPSTDVSTLLSNTAISSLGLRGCHVSTVTEFTRDQLHLLFNVAHTMRTDVQHGRQLDSLLKVYFLKHGCFSFVIFFSFLNLKKICRLYRSCLMFNFSFFNLGQGTDDSLL